MDVPKKTLKVYILHLGNMKRDVLDERTCPSQTQQPPLALLQAISPQLPCSHQARPAPTTVTSLLTPSFSPCTEILTPCVSYQCPPLSLPLFI